MSNLVLTAEIDAAPPGPRIGAFFDFDGTLIDGYSARAFFEDRLRRREVPPLELARSLVAGLDMVLRGADVTGLMQVAAEASRGRPEDEMVQIGERLFVQRVAGLVYPEARTLVAAHQRRGHTVVLASSATPYQVGPLAADLGIEHILCTRLEVREGVFTGQLDGPVLWGEGKAAAVRKFAAGAGIDLADSWGYANGDEDVAFLETVGRPRPLNPGGRLARVAAERGWPVRRFRRRGGFDLSAAVRTGAAAWGLGAAVGVGLGLGVLNRSRRDAVNLTASIGSDVALALAGVRLRVAGEEHLWSDRPAVFLFNHQSALDVLIVANLLRRDLTGVAKKEAAHDPRFAVLGALAGVAYVDRADRARAVASLDEVTQRIRDGISIAIAPEGTRSPTHRLRPFKKGAFHMAMQAKVPVVPIVIRNAGDLMWRRSFLIRPGVVDVAVLPPVPTEGWSLGDLDDRVEEIRALYLDTFARWPEA